MRPPSILTDVLVATVRTVLPQRGAVANARDAVLRDRWSAAQRQDAAAAAARVAGHPSALQSYPVPLAAGPPPMGGRLGIPLARADLERVADVAPDVGFAAAAEDALDLLHRVLTMDVWMVAAVEDGLERVVVARGPGGARVPGGPGQPWAESYCRLMVTGQAPRVAPRVRDVPAYAALPATRRWGIAAYVGVPLLTSDGALFGVLCGVATRERDERLAAALPAVERVARLLSTVLAKEAAALERSQAAAHAYALADRDAATGVLNRRGWHARLTIEEERRRRRGHLASVLLVRVDEPPGGRAGERAEDAAPRVGDDVVRRVAEVLCRVARTCDAVARLAAAEFGVLAVDCDAAEVAVLARRIRDVLHHDGIAVTLGTASGSNRQDLLEAWRRADAEVEDRTPVVPPPRR